ncbi:MAG: WecB/TagA/CpsF family glycosyltransferase [Porphyrobacter sp.]|nr:WecB/TagA/CpsF family glycosyltransferase [Porphyrobacter sp.]
MAALERLTKHPGVSLVVTPNVDHIVMLKDPEGDPETAARFGRAYDAAAIRLCDSRVLQALAWFEGIRLDVVTGSDLTAQLFENGCLDGRSVALIGGDDSMPAALKARFPEVDLVQHIPPMGVLANEPAIAAIEAFLKGRRWDYILFAIGAPRSEIIAHRMMGVEGIQGVAICVGASIEFLLGRKKRAPRWMQKARLEWAFRLSSEPRRLWRRYLIKGPRILAIVRDWKRSNGKA